MRIRKNMVLLWFVYGFVIIMVLVFIGIYVEIDSIKNVYVYKKVAVNDEFLWKKNIDYLNFKKKFLQKTNGVIGIIDIGSRKNCPVYSMDFKNFSNDNFFGDISLKKCALVKINNFNFENLNLYDEIRFSCLGDRKKFVVEEIKDIYNFNEDVYFNENSKSFNILVCKPYVMSNRKVLIKTKEVENLNEYEMSFFDLILKSPYLVVCFIIFLFIFAFFIKKIYCFFKERKNTIMIKYVKNPYIFKRNID